VILTLFGFLVGFSLVLIIIGLTKPTESAQALIGFFFLFLLSFQILNGTLTYESGAVISHSYLYSNASLTSSQETVTYSYVPFQDHTFGYYLAIGSAIGFFGVIFSLGRGRVW